MERCCGKWDFHWYCRTEEGNNWRSTKWSLSAHVHAAFDRHRNILDSRAFSVISASQNNLAANCCFDMCRSRTPSCLGYYWLSTWHSRRSERKSIWWKSTWAVLNPILNSILSMHLRRNLWWCLQRHYHQQLPRKQRMHTLYCSVHHTCGFHTPKISEVFAGHFFRLNDGLSLAKTFGH